MKRLLIIPALLVLLTILAACGDDEVVAEINEVSYTAMDYFFEGPQFLPSGMTELTLVNEGMELHHQQLLTLPEGMTADDLIAGLMSFCGSIFRSGRSASRVSSQAASACTRASTA